MDAWLSNKLESIRSGKATNHISEVDAASQVGSLTASSQTVEQTHAEIIVYDPNRLIEIKEQSRSTTLFRSGLEMSQVKKHKKQRTCGNCGEKGHYRTSCPSFKMNAGDTNVGEIGLEISREDKHKKQRTCGNCGGKGHYRTSCPNFKMDVEHLNVGEIGPCAS